MANPSPAEPTHLSGEHFVAAAGSLVLHIVAASSFFGFIGFVLPLLDRVYKERGVELTATAEPVLMAARYYTEFWVYVILAVAAIDLVIVILLVRLPRERRWILTGYNYLWLVVALLLVSRSGALAVAPLKAWLQS
jgi:type II secretory pathway component PulF